MPPASLSPLYAILDVESAERQSLDPLDLLAIWLPSGVRLVQLRAKHSSSGAFLHLAEAAQAALAAAGGRLVVNDRADIARLAGASGVHVGQDDLPVRAARAVVGDAALVGRSTHTPEQIDVALAEPISYLAIGPIFATSTKPQPYAPVGLDGVRLAARRAARCGLPVVAIGGITLDAVPDVLQAGAASVAVIGDLLAGDPADRARAFVAATSAAAGARRGAR